MTAASALATTGMLVFVVGLLVIGVAVGVGRTWVASLGGVVIFAAFVMWVISIWMQVR